MNEELSEKRSDRSVFVNKVFTKIHRYRSLLARCWWVFLLTVPVAMGIQAWRISTAPPLYESTSQMIVNVRLNTQQGSLGALYSEELSNFLGTQAALMQGGTVLSRARDTVLAENQDLKQCPIKVGVNLLPKTTIYVMTATGAEPKYTQKFLQAAMAQYINLKKEMVARTSDATIAGITEQIQKLNRDIDQIDNQTVSFLGTNEVLLEQSTGMAQFLNVLYGQLAQAQSQYDLLNSMTLDQNLLIERSAPAAMLRSGADIAASGSVLLTAGIGEQSGMNAANSIGMEYLTIKQQILLLKADKERLGEYLKPRHPRMVSIDESTDRLNRLLVIYRDQSIEQLEARKSALALQIKNLQKQTKELASDSLSLTRKNAEYERLKSRSQRLLALRDQLGTSLQTIDVNKEINPESVTIYQDACEAMPVRASLPRGLLLAALMGIALGLGILFVLDRMDDRMISFTELQEFFDEPVLGQIPRESKEKKSGQIELLHSNDSRMPFVESFRNLRSSLLFASTEGTHSRTLIVTSSAPGEGKSLTASNLAISLAMSGSRVLLVDADLRKGELHKRFGIIAEMGLGQMLSQKLDWRTVVVETPVANLRFMSRGNADSKSTEYFFAHDMADFIVQAGKEYDYVIIDTPPVMVADDASSLAPRVDAVLFVIRAEKTSARVARASLDLLEQRNARIAGLVFNDVRHSVGDYHYYGHYKDYHAS